jgi:hypothetical protein
MILFLVSTNELFFLIKIKFCFFIIIEDTYWKPDVVDQQEVLVKVMDTYGKVNQTFDFSLNQNSFYLRMINVCLII